MRVIFPLTTPEAEHHFERRWGIVFMISTPTNLPVSSPCLFPALFSEWRRRSRSQSVLHWSSSVLDFTLPPTHYPRDPKPQHADGQRGAWENLRTRVKETSLSSWSYQGRTVSLGFILSPPLEPRRCRVGPTYERRGGLDPGPSDDSPRRRARVDPRRLRTSDKGMSLVSSTCFTGSNLL